MPFAVAAVFGLTWWLGLYLIAREPGARGPWRAGLGLTVYALALAVGQIRAALTPDGTSPPGTGTAGAHAAAGGAAIISGTTAPAGAGMLAGVETVLICLPMLLWTGAVLTLIPSAERLERAWARGLVPITLVAIAWLLMAGAGLAPVSGSGVFGDLTPEGTVSEPLTAGGALPGAAASGGDGVEVLGIAAGGMSGLGTAARVVVGVLLFVPLAGVLVPLVRARPVRAGRLAAVATLFFGLGAALVVFPMLGPPEPWMVLAIDVDMVLLGVAIAMSSAFQAGETLWRDMARSLLGALVVALAAGGQVVLAAAVEGLTPVLVTLLFGVIAVAVAVQVLAAPVHRALDRVVFAGDSRIRRERAELRESSDALARRDQGPPPLDEAEFGRLTRRALANYGDLGKLASSPLAGLPAIDKRVTGDIPLERAAALKHLLLASILRLKPSDGEFGTSEEWRYYNVLYFPYVRGLRPYRRGASRHGLSPVERQAFDWFVREVPERTLYNWQNTAARLVADDLRRENAL